MSSRYPTDLPDEHWALIEPMIPPAKPGRLSIGIGMGSDAG